MEFKSNRHYTNKLFKVSYTEAVENRKIFSENTIKVKINKLFNRYKTYLNQIVIIKKIQYYLTYRIKNIKTLKICFFFEVVNYIKPYQNIRKIKELKVKNKK